MVKKNFCSDQSKTTDVYLHLKEDEVDDGVSLGEEVSEDAGGVATLDLHGRETEVDAAEEVPHLHRPVVSELPKKEGRTFHPFTAVEAFNFHQNLQLL